MRNWPIAVWISGLIIATNTYAVEMGTSTSYRTDESPIRVTIQGANKELSDNLKAYLPSLRRLTCRATAEQIERFIIASRPKLQEGAEAVGYFDAQFNMTSTFVNGCLAFNIRVVPGEAVRVTQQDIRITGPDDSIEGFSDLKNSPPYEIGDILVQQNYEDYKGKLSRRANRLGFFDAQYNKRELQVDPDKLEAAVVIDYDTGKRYRFSEVNIEQDVLDNENLNHYLRVKPGDYYDSDVLLKQQRLLEASEYYNDVQLKPGHDKADNLQIPIDIIATRRKRYTYTGKLGYGTDTKMRLEAKMDAHWVNKKGHKLTIKGIASQPEAELGFSYKVPLWQPEHEFAAFSSGWRSSVSDDVESSAFTNEFSYNRRNDNDWQQTAFVRHLYETTETSGENETVSQLSLLGLRLSKTKSDDALFPTFGWQFSFELIGAKEGLLSDQSILQAKVGTKYLKTLDSGSKLILQGSAGGSMSDELKEMPKSLRFFAGGQNSIRGYNYQSLGKVDEQGKVIGGKNVLTGSIEYERPLSEKWSIAGFVDAGNAFEDWSDYELKVGFGAGVRYKSPFGPIRADLALPKDDSKDIHFYFSLGPDL